MFKSKGILRIKVGELTLAHQDKAIIPLAHVAYVAALQVTEHTVNDFLMSEAVQADQNALLKQDCMKMIFDVVRENQRQPVNLATASVAMASKQFPEMVEYTEEERKEA